MHRNKSFYTFALIILICINMPKQLWASNEIDNLIFSHTRGIYENAFELTISASTSHTTIKYTLDGSNPMTSRSARSGTSPLSLSIDPDVVGDRGGKTPGVVLRAYSVGSQTIETHSYLFVDKVATQSTPGGIWPATQYTSAWPGYDAAQSIAYKVNTDISRASQYKDVMDDALLQIPSYSLVMDNDDLFDEDSGIYVNAMNDELVRQVSVELLDPTTGESFQADAGIKIRGRYSRLPRNPKHSMRLLFKEEYGQAKLDYPVFGDNGPSQFDRLDFRTAQNSAFHSGEDKTTVTYIKEIVSRDIQHEMNHPGTQSDYCHLYLNGAYWGIYQIQERAEKYFAEEYLGGQKEDYDVVKPQKDVANPSNDLKIGTSDGNLEAAERLWDAMNNGFSDNSDYFAIQGKNADGTINPNYEKLLDVENLIDYILVSFYTGSRDGPGVTWIGLWGNMVRPNNFIGLYNRENPDGFKWIVHDMEKCMYDKNEHDYISGLGASWYKTDFEFFSPLTLHKELSKNAEYKVKFADRVHKYFTEGKLLTPESITEMLKYRRDQIDMAIIAESARWSWWVSSQNDPSKEQWTSNINTLLTSYVPYRTDLVLGYLADIGLSSDLSTPVLQEGDDLLLNSSTTIEAGTTLTFKTTGRSSGNIYYTTNNEDPRAIGGSVTAFANKTTANATLSINDGSIIKARILENGQWSALYKVTLKVNKANPALVITELHYHPKSTSAQEEDELEFIEIKNIGINAIDLTGFSFSEGIDYTFGSKSIAPKAFIVLTSNAQAFTEKYQFSPDGEYEGQLANSGEELAIINAEGSTVLTFSYNDKQPWPLSADGYGNSLEASSATPTQSPNDPYYWQASTQVGGSPASDGHFTPVYNIIINEVLANPTGTEVEKIELKNRSDQAINIGGWYLSDNDEHPYKWQIPAHTTIEGQGFIVFDSSDFGLSFALNSHQEEVILSTDSNATNYYSTAISFYESNENQSYGNYTNSIGETHFVPMTSLTFDQENDQPQSSPIRFTHLNYHPQAGGYEYLRLQNVSGEAIALFAANNPAHTWTIKGIDFSFPQNTTMAADEIFYIIEEGIDAERFKTVQQITESCRTFGMSGKLSNAGESIALYKAVSNTSDNLVKKRHYQLLEAIKYSDQDPWPSAADGEGYRLARLDIDAYANDPINWQAEQETITSLNTNSLTNALELYPNPAKQSTKLVLPEEISTGEVEVWTSSGRCIYRREIQGQQITLDVSTYTQGLYMVAIRANGKRMITKLIVK